MTAGRARRARRLRPRPRRAGQRRRPRAHAGLRRPLGALSAHAADRRGPRRRSAGGPDGQLRGRAPEHRRRAHRRAGSGAHLRRRRRRLAGVEPRAAGGASPRRATGAACCTSPAWSRTEACTRTSTTCARSSAAPSPRECRASRCTPSPTAATSRRIRPRACWPLLEREWAGTGAAIATVVGRFYAMDRDHRAERTELARAALVDGVGERAEEAGAAVEASYARGLTDEFVTPIVLGDPALRIAPGDPLVFFNFRPDRARQICHALAADGRAARHDDALRRRARRARDVRRRAPARHARRRAGVGRPAPAARRGDREVRARDVLLRRRPRGEPRRRGLGARAVAPRRADLRPRARDGGRGRRRALRGALSATATHSRSSTSRTPTWWGTAACCRP